MACAPPGKRPKNCAPAWGDRSERAAKPGSAPARRQFFLAEKPPPVGPGRASRGTLRLVASVFLKWQSAQIPRRLALNSSHRWNCAEPVGEAPGPRPLAISAQPRSVRARECSLYRACVFQKQFGLVRGYQRFRASSSASLAATQSAPWPVISFFQNGARDFR